MNIKKTTNKVSDFVKQHEKFLLLILCALILFYRNMPSFLHPMFWAEGGTFFFRQNFVLGLQSFIIPVAGYLCVAQRMVASFAGLFPLATIPAIYTYVNFGLILLLCNKISSPRFKVSYKALFVLAIVLIPTRGEIYNFNCIQWILSVWLLILVVQEQSKSYVEAMGDYIVLFLLGLTGPFIFFFVPLYFVKYIQKRNSYNLGLVSIAAVTAIIQAFFVLHFYVGNSAASHIFHNASISVALKALIILGQRFFAHAFYMSILPSWISAILLLTMPIWMFILIKPRKKLYNLFFIFLYYCIVTIFAGIFRMLTIYKMKDFSQLPHAVSMLYDANIYLPILMMSWMLILALSSTKIRKYIATVLLVLMLLQSLHHFKFKIKIHENFHWEKYSKLIETTNKPLSIPINPRGWLIRIPKRSQFSTIKVS